MLLRPFLCRLGALINVAMIVGSNSAHANNGRRSNQNESTVAPIATFRSAEKDLSHECKDEVNGVQQGTSVARTRTERTG